MGLGGLLTLGAFATAVPTMLGVLMAYALVATVLGTLLWTGKSIPDDVGITIAASGAIIGLMVLLGALFVRFVLS